MSLEIKTFLEVSGGLEITNVSGGWAARCPTCGVKRWVDGGYALFWTDTGNIKGWHGWGPHGEHCPTSQEHRVEPMHYRDQAPYLALHLLAGESAVTAILPVWPDHWRGWRRDVSAK